MQKHLLSVLVTNHYGVLMRVTNLFSRRGYNISALTVGETANPEYSRITILTEGDDRRVIQIMKQLQKLEDVRKVVKLEDERHVTRELLLLKIKADAAQRKAFEKTAVDRGAVIVSREGDSVICQLTGTTDDVDSLIETARQYGLAEICRTGATGMQIGEQTVYTT